MHGIKKIILITFVILSISIFGIVAWNTFFYSPSDEISIPVSLKDISVENNKIFPDTQKKTLSKKDPKELYFLKYPKELIIPSIHVKTKIQYVGITKKGNMATPNNFSDVGWFKYGVLPGKKGSSIIAGHVDNGLGLPAVFYHLDNLSAGDDVYINTVNGETIHFIVTDMQTYDFNAPTEEIFNQDNGNFLKLITCAGTWVNAFKTHNKRLVITAKLA